VPEHAFPDRGPLGPKHIGIQFTHIYV